MLPSFKSNAGLELTRGGNIDKNITPEEENRSRTKTLGSLSSNEFAKEVLQT
jgi:hypothetical protein